jgi:hypothetical protein
VEANLADRRWGLVCSRRARTNVRRVFLTIYAHISRAKRSRMETMPRTVPLLVTGM